MEWNKYITRGSGCNAGVYYMYITRECIVVNAKDSKNCYDNWRTNAFT